MKIEFLTKDIPLRITLLYDYGWNINPLNHKWVKGSIETNLNEAYMIQLYRNG